MRQSPALCMKLKKCKLQARKIEIILRGALDPFSSAANRAPSKSVPINHELLCDMLLESRVRVKHRVHHLPPQGGAKLIYNLSSPTDRPGRPLESGSDPDPADRPTLLEPW